MDTCNMCEGEGEIFDCYDEEYNETYTQICPYCNGRGVIDYECR